jgi:negative regulator of flagellin synthesis FlgM
MGGTPDMAETLRLLEQISRMPDIRFEKVQQMRELIAEGQFETPERVDGAVRRLMEELGL